LRIARHGAARQETARLTVEQERAVALVGWYPLRGGGARAFEFTFHKQPEGWQLTAMDAIPTQNLVPRSQRLCMS
ncbi:MAG: hypothetical protein ACRDIB_20275, partial [Ardenticatenaceae bacterium]